MSHASLHNITGTYIKIRRMSEWLMEHEFDI